jgi:CBS domain-containing protein
MMSRRFVTVAPETPMADVAQKLLKRRTAWAAVVDAAGDFVGFVSAQGVLGAFVEFLHDEMPVGPASRYLDPEPPALQVDTPLLDAIEAFVGAGRVVYALPVLRGGELVGVVRRLDAVRAAMQYFAAGGKALGPGTLYMSALKGSEEKPPY